MQLGHIIKFRYSAIALVALLMAFDVSANESVELTDGVIIDLSEGRVYLMRPEPAIESIAIDSGEVIWTNDDAAKPLAIQDNKLVTQADVVDTPNVLNLVIMDVENDGQVISRSPVTLPSNVSAFVDEGLTGRFRSRAVALNQEAYVSWEYQAIPRQGIVMGMPDKDPAQPSGAPVMPTPSQSTLKLNLQTGETSRIEQQDIPGNAAMAFIPGRGAAPSDPTLRISVDGRHVLKYEQVANDSEWEKYIWTISDVETGDELGQLRSHLSQADFVIVDSDTIIFETGAFLRRTDKGMQSEPRSVRAVSLQSGREIWSRPLRDTAYRGAFPP